MQAAVSPWLYNRADLAEVIPSFIALAEAQMDAKVRHPLLTVRNEAFVLAGELTGLPDGFRAMVSVATAAGVLAFAPLDEMAKARRIRGGRPAIYSVLGEQLQVWPAPQAGETASLVYQAALARLSDTNPSNWILQRYPNAYLYGALQQAAPYLDEDGRVAVWGRLFQDAIDDINAAGRIAGRGVGLTVRAGTPTP